MKKLLFFSLTFSAVCSFNACTHHNEEVIINISSPTTNSQYTSGAPITISADFEGELHKCMVKVTNTTNNVEVMNYIKHEHTGEIIVDTTFTPIVSAITNFELLMVHEDHDGNETEKSVAFTVNP